MPAFFSLVLLLLLLGAGRVVDAAVPDHPALAEKSALAAPWTRVDRAVRETIAGAAPSPRGRLAPRSAIPRDPAGRIRLAVYVSSWGTSERALLEAGGLRITFESARFGFVEGWASPDEVGGLASLDFVTTVRPVASPITNTGSVSSQGDTIHRANIARQSFGVSGAGVKVGVLSDSVDGLDTAVASGDLPAGVQVLQAGTGLGEGTAMLEIVHDLAPGAPLAFYGPNSSGDMIAGIEQLAANGASVIVDDIWWFDQPIYEEGPIAQTVNDQVARNVVYATSAVNSAQKHYGSTFSSAGGSRPLHQFAPGQTRQRITVQPGSARIMLYWADQWGRSANDYDLYLVTQDGTVIAQSDNEQNGDDLPLESLTVTNEGRPAQAFIVVQLFNGSPRRFDIFYNNVTEIEFGSPVSSIPGHANARGAITVAAANVDNPFVIADYSSRGPCNIVFPVLETRAKPDITGIAGVAVTGAAGFSNPFFGTSAAAPHVAALAALVRQANPELSATQIKELLMATATDLGDVGYDYTFGAGGADGFSAVERARALLPVDPCAGQTIPAPLLNRITRAQAALAAGKLKRARVLGRKARKLANGYTRGKRPKLTAECAGAIAAALP